MGLLNKQGGKQLWEMTHFFPSSTKESFNVLNAIVTNFIVSPISLLSQNKPPHTQSPLLIPHSPPQKKES